VLRVGAVPVDELRAVLAESDVTLEDPAEGTDADA
jgi:hypothetical protein